MIVYKIKDNKIVSVSRKDENYVIKEGEFGADTWFQKPFWNGTAVVETITQAEIDAQNVAKIKQDNITAFYGTHSVVWVGKNPIGEDWGVVIGIDGKLTTIKIN